MRCCIADGIVTRSAASRTVTDACRACCDGLAAAGIFIGIAQRDAGECIARHDASGGGDVREVIRLSCIRRAAVVHLADGIGRDRDRLGRNRECSRTVAAGRNAVVAGIGTGQGAHLLVIAASRSACGGCHDRGRPGLIDSHRSAQGVTRQRPIQTRGTWRGKAAVSRAGIVHQPGQRLGRDSAVGATEAAAGQIVVACGNTAQSQAGEAVALVGVADVLVSIGAAAGYADEVACDLVADCDSTRNSRAADSGVPVIYLAQRARTDGERGAQRRDREVAALRALAGEIVACLCEVTYRHRVVADRTGGAGSCRQIEGPRCAHAIVKCVMPAARISQGQRTQGLTAAAVVIGRACSETWQHVAINLVC